MRRKYTAKIYFEDGESLEKSGDNLEELTAWIYAQGEAGDSDIHGEITDNVHHRIIKSVQYSPPE